MSCTSLREAAYDRFCRRRNRKSIAPYRHDGRLYPAIPIPWYP